MLANKHTYTLILVFGDHDPAGMCIPNALEEFLNEHAERGQFEIQRLGLNMDQVTERRLPPQRVKDDEYALELGKSKGDPSAEAYKEEFGTECWELDALSPAEIQGLLRAALAERVDQSAIESVKKLEPQMRDDLVAALSVLGEEDYSQ